MHEGEIDENVCSEGVADPDNWHGHFRAEVVDHMEEISGVIHP